MPRPPHRRRQIKPMTLLLGTILAATSVALAAPETTAELLQKSRTAYQSGDAKAAVELADQAVAADPKSADVYLFRASLHEAMRSFDKAIGDRDKLVELRPDDAGMYLRRGSTHFRAGHIEESIRDFDKVVELEPQQEAELWQRGIAHYYAGRFADGRKQFELHQTVNSRDVENAVWHYLCVARLDGVEAAREKLIPITGDARVPMAEVQALFAGKGTPEAVLAAAKAGEPGGDRLADRMFYAHLYLGLFHEAAGEAAKAREHIDLAAGKYAQDHYMGDVARVHAARLREAEESKDEPKAKPEPEPEHAAPADPS